MIYTDNALHDIQRYITITLEACDMTQRDLADEFGVNESTVSRWLHDKKVMSYKQVVSILSAISNHNEKAKRLISPVLNRLHRLEALQEKTLNDFKKDLQRWENEAVTRNAVSYADRIMNEVYSKEESIREGAE